MSQRTPAGVRDLSTRRAGSSKSPLPDKSAAAAGSSRPVTGSTLPVRKAGRQAASKAPASSPAAAKRPQADRQAAISRVPHVRGISNAQAESAAGSPNAAPETFQSPESSLSSCSSGSGSPERPATARSPLQPSDQSNRDAVRPAQSDAGDSLLSTPRTMDSARLSVQSERLRMLKEAANKVRKQAGSAGLGAIHSQPSAQQDCATPRQPAYTVQTPDSGSDAPTPNNPRSKIMAELRSRDSQGSGVPNEKAAIQWQQMTPTDAAAMIASKPSQLAISMLRQGNFEGDCNSALQQSRNLLVDLVDGRRSLTSAESLKVAGALQGLQSLLAQALDRQTAWVAGCQQWEQALFAHVRYTEQVVHAACAARQEARGQLTLSRARQSAHEASLAEKDASIAQLKRKVKNLEAQRESENEPNDHFSASSWLKMLQAPN